MDISTIRTAANTIIAQELGATFKELPYLFDVAENEDRHLKAGYAVTFGDGAQVFVIDQAVNIEQDIDVVVAARVFVRNDDEKIMTTIDGLYAKIGNIIKRFCMDKIDSASIVQRVELSSIGKPDMLDKGRDVVMVPMKFRVRYLIT